MAGPVAGAVGKETRFWLLTKGNAAGNFTAQLQNNSGGLDITTFQIQDKVCLKDTCSIVLTFSNVQEDNSYTLKMSKNGIPLNAYDRTFELPKGGSATNFSFLTGSCSYVREAGESFGSKNLNIMANMKNEADARFMLWLGDILYLRYGHPDFLGNYGLEYNDTNQIFRRYVVDRRVPLKKEFFESKFHFGIWDDHDYGANNAGADNIYKDYVLKVFKSFLPNASFPSNNKGMYSKYSYADADFFLTDSRFFQTSKHYLGEQQMKWLKDELKKSTATFKFICVGTTVIWERNETSEVTLSQTGEKAELFQFIQENNISGVIFLSGDQHFSYFSRENQDCENTYPIYEFMSSPISSRTRSLTPTNTDVLATYHNYSYGLVKLSGSVGNRQCVFEMKDTNGVVVRTLTLHENDLKPLQLQTSKMAQYNFQNSLNDESGNNQHAQTYGTIGFGSGRFNDASQSATFSGSDARLVFPSSVLHDAEDFTVSMWLKPTQDNYNGYLSAASSLFGNELLIHNTNGTLDFFVKNQKISSSINITLDKWCHIVCTRKESTGRCRIYINGNEVAEGVLPKGKLEISAQALIFGNDQDNAGGGGFDITQQFIGEVDEITFFNRALCVYNIDSLYKVGCDKITLVKGDTLCSPSLANFKAMGTSEGRYLWYQNENDVSPLSGNQSLRQSQISSDQTLWVSAQNYFSESKRVAVNSIVLNPILKDKEENTYPHGLSAWYTFDGHMNDSSIHQLHATHSGIQYAIGKDGKANTAIDFEEFGDVVNLPHQLLNGKHKISISWWMKTQGSNEGILSAASTKTGNELLIYNSSFGKLEGTFREVVKSSDLVLNNNLWKHVVLTIDLLNKEINFYINGIIQPAFSVYPPNDFFDVPLNALILGNDQDLAGGGGLSSTQQYKGLLDDLRFYDRILSAQEIQDLFVGNDYFKKAINFNSPSTVICEGDEMIVNIIAPQTDVVYYAQDENSIIVSANYQSNSSNHLTLNTKPTAGSKWLKIIGKRSDNLCSSELTQIPINEVNLSKPFIQYQMNNTLCSSVSGDYYQWLFNDLELVNQTSCIPLQGEGKYQVVVHQQGCVSDSSEIYLYQTTLSESNENKALEIYPNPLNDKLFLKSNIDFGEIKEIKIYRSNGEMIYGQKGDINNVISFEWGAGMYWIEISSATNRIIKKLVVVN